MALKQYLAKFLPNSGFIKKIADYPEYEAWKKPYRGSCPEFKLRYDMYRMVQNQVAEHPIVYLEFGVFKGESIKFWTEINKGTESKFYGFDTFEGLPEDWIDSGFRVEKETFDVKGNIPVIDDKRVAFYKGLFQDTMDDFLSKFERSNSRLIIHNDSDLLSSSIYLLTKLDPFLLKGDIIIFDEFYSLRHEFLAFNAYVKAFRRTFKPIAHVSDFGKVAFELL